jgi:hypothetical protein
MSDFPQDGGGVLPLHLSSLSQWGIGHEVRVVGGGVSPGAIVWTANQAVYMPIAIPWSYPVRRVWWVNGSTVTSTNVDFGIYSLGGKKIFSTGSTTQVGASLPQYVTPATPFVLAAGSYYFAWVCDNTTARGWGLAPASAGSLCGCQSQATALPLPASASFVRYVSASGVELCGVTRTASGF